MSATAESTRWDELAPFRASFLRHFTQPEDRAALERVGHLLFEHALEFSRHWPKDPEPTVSSQVRAAVEDLRYLTGYLEMVGAERQFSTLEPEEHRLCQVVSAHALDLERLTDTLSASIR